ncbi:MAG: hypothetical protein IKU21_03640 [Anaerotignum sp.]|nr:hypothetical protein [Anaerotignum sp.]
MENMDYMINELTTALEAMDPEILAGGILFTAGAIVAIIAYGILRYLMAAIGYSKMYRKAGEDGWKAFIPFYNTYTNYKIAWTGKFFFLYAALYILFAAISNSTYVALQLAAAAAGIALIVVDVKQHVKMAKAFGKNAFTGIALIFFTGITSLILGLGKAEYQDKMIENN